MPVSWLRRKQKARQDSMNYEFEALNGDDLEEGVPSNSGGAGGAGAAAGGRRKARDLYDAFGASDDDEAYSDDESDSDTDSQNEKTDYYNEAEHGLDEGDAGGDRAKLLGRDNR